MKTTKRAVRRHHYQRRKQRILDKNYFGRSKLEWLIEYPNCEGFFANTPKSTSCFCCSSPRHTASGIKERLTRQELRAEFIYKEYLKEYYSNGIE